MTGERELAAAGGLARPVGLRVNALRLGGELRQADLLFAEVFPHPEDPGDRSFLYRVLVLLRRDQGRLDEAAILMRRSAELAAEVARTAAGLSHEEGASLALLGLFLLESDAERSRYGLEAAAGAAPSLERACALLDPGRAPWLASLAGFACAVCLADLERTDAARAACETAARHLAGTADRAGTADPAGEASLRLFQGRAWLRLGDTKAAEEAFEAARAAAFRLQLLAEAFQASLHLGVVWGITERRDSLDRLAARLRAAFGPSAESAARALEELGCEPDRLDLSPPLYADRATTELCRKLALRPQPLPLP